MFKTFAGLAVLATALACASSTFSAPPGAGSHAAAPAAHAPLPTAAATAPASEAAHALERADLEAWLDGRVPYALKAGDLAGVEIAVVKDGKVLLEKGYGYADVANETPMNPQTIAVRPGSTSKLFTWTAVMQQVQAGKIDLDRDVNAYLDFTIPHKNGKAVTMRDLMNHRAGFEEGLKDVLSVDPRHAQSTAQYLKTHPRPQLFTPGDVPAYSNYGAALAGYIVERVSGEPFEQYVQRHIFSPLGMTHSTFVQPLPKSYTTQVSKGYMSASQPPFPYELILTRPAGSLTTTADDMTHFMIAQLQDGRYGDAQILSSATAQLMHSPSETGPEGFDVLAHGFFYGHKNGRVFIGHGGDSIVFHTEMNLLPSEGVGIYYTFNTRGPAGSVYLAREQLFDGFMDRYFPGPAPTPAPTLSSAKADAAAIAGRYQSSRRVEHGFMSVLYLLQQSTIAARPDGSISAPGFLSGQKTFHEVGPQIWRADDGQGQLALRTVDGVKTVIDSQDPTSVLQAAPLARSSGLDLPILLVSALVLIWSALLWPLSALLRRGEPAASAAPPQVRRLRLNQRLAACGATVWLLAWFAMIQPLLGTQLQVYGGALDPVVGALELSGFVIVLLAGLSVFAAWKMLRSGATWLTRIWSVAEGLAMLGLVWLGVIGGLIGYNLNY